jgi:hypothetical protein
LTTRVSILMRIRLCQSLLEAATTTRRRSEEVSVRGDLIRLNSLPILRSLLGSVIGLCWLLLVDLWSLKFEWVLNMSKKRRMLTYLLNLWVSLQPSSEYPRCCGPLLVLLLCWTNFRSTSS